MHMVPKLVKYNLFNVARSRWIFAYSILVFVIALLISRFSPSSTKAVLSMTNIYLILLPLMSLIFTTLYFYDSKGFYELLLSQNVSRMHLLSASLISLSLATVFPFIIFSSLPYMYFFGFETALMLFVSLFSYVILFFVLLGFLVGILVKDKLKGMGIAVGFWMFFSIIYDMLIFYFIVVFSDYPIEHAVFIMVVLNPCVLLRNAMLSYLGLEDVIVPFDINYVVALPVHIFILILILVLIFRRFGRMDF